MIVTQEDDLEQEHQVRRLEERLRRLTIIGTPETLVAGNLEQGYSVDTQRKKVAIGGCCVGSDCGITTEDQCLASDGTYQGDWTDCDPNPCSAACCQLTLQFHSVLLDCGCLDQGAGNSTIIEDDGFFNDNPIQICVGDCPELGCDSFTNRGDGCYCGGDGETDHHYFHEKEWTAAEDCSGDPDFEGDILACGFGEGPIISLQLITGVWHLVMYSWDGEILLFYGTTTDLSLNIDNQLSCGGDIPAIPDACRWPPIFSPTLIASDGGYASIASSGIVCGACCYDTECITSTDFACSANGGVYQGDGTLCDPSPC